VCCALGCRLADRNSPGMVWLQRFTREQLSPCGASSFPSRCAMRLMILLKAAKWRPNVLFRMPDRTNCILLVSGAFGCVSCFRRRPRAALPCVGCRRTRCGQSFVGHRRMPGFCSCSLFTDPVWCVQLALGAPYTTSSVAPQQCISSVFSAGVWRPWFVCLPVRAGVAPTSEMRILFMDAK
jgi:hypothetical protein